MCSEFADDGVANGMSSDVTECEWVVESDDFGNSVGMHSGLLRV